LFVHFQGSFECVRCRRMSEAWIQTKLLRHERDNCSRPYRIGESEILVGLDDYCPLYPRDGSSPLTVAVGDWVCEHCSLHWQWAKAVFEVKRRRAELVGTITDLSGLQPVSPAALDGVHFCEDWLAEFSGLWDRHPHYNFWTGLARWEACPVLE